MMKCSVTFLIIFFGKTKDLLGINICLTKVSLSVLLAFLREQNVLMSLLLPKKIFMSSEIIGKLFTSRLIIKVTEFRMFELTLSPDLIGMNQI